MFFRFLFSIFLFVAIAPFITAQEVLQEQKGIIAGQHFKLMAPVDWQCIENTVRSQHFNLARPSKNADALLEPTIKITYRSLVEFEGGVEEYVDSSDKVFQSFFPSALLENRESIEFLGVNAKRFTVSIAEGKVKKKMLLTLFFIDEKMFKIYFTAEEEDFDIYLEEAKTILDSFEFVEADAIPKDVPAVLIFDDLHFFTQKEATHFSYFQEDIKRKYASPEERNEFMHEAFNLLFAVGNVDFDQAAYYEKTYFDFLKKLAEDIPLKKRKNKIQEIYDLIYETFFDQYGENVMFYDIFKSKTYNCVTASALYSIAFDYLEIPYTIKEMPRHVYLIVYPDEDRIVLETTSYNFGLLPLNKTNISKRKKFSLDNGLVSEKSDTDVDSKQIYTDVYSRDLEISLTNLIGVLYFNHSILKADSLDYDEAIIELEKGKELCAFIDLHGLEEGLSGMLLEKNGTYLSLEQFCIIAVKNYKANADARFNEEYRDYFLHFLYEIAHNNEAADISTEFIPCLSEKINNPPLIESIEYTSQMKLAEEYFRYGRYKRALNYLKGKYHSDDVPYQAMIEKCVMAYIQDNGNKESILEFTNKVRTDFPRLVEEEWFESIDAY